MSITALRWAFRVPVKGAQKAVLIALADHADERGSCFPSMRRIGLWAGVSARGARKAIRQLEECGLIATLQRPNGTSTYRLLVSPETSQPRPERKTGNFPVDKSERAPERDAAVPPAQASRPRNQVPVPRNEDPPPRNQVPPNPQEPLLKPPGAVNMSNRQSNRPAKPGAAAAPPRLLETEQVARMLGRELSLEDVRTLGLWRRKKHSFQLHVLPTIEAKIEQRGQAAVASKPLRYWTPAIEERRDIRQLIKPPARTGQPVRTPAT